MIYQFHLFVCNSVFIYEGWLLEYLLRVHFFYFVDIITRNPLPPSFDPLLILVGYGAIWFWAMGQFDFELWDNLILSYGTIWFWAMGQFGFELWNKLILSYGTV